MNNSERILLIVTALVVGLVGGVVSARLLPQRRTTVVAKEIVLLDQQGDVRVSVSIEPRPESSVVFKDHTGKVIGTIPPTAKVMPLHE
jgi:uncharacterized iron-regulated membrane protein